MTRFARLRWAIMAIVLTFAALQSTVRAQDGEPPQRSLVGVWFVTLTPRSCDTGAPVAPGIPFIWTIHQDGTMAVSVLNNVTALNRSLGHGLWQREQGWNSYAYKHVHYRQTTATNAFAGKQESGGPLVLNESGDEFTTADTTVVFTIDGNPSIPFCSTSLGKRFELQP